MVLRYCGIAALLINSIEASANTYSLHYENDENYLNATTIGFGFYEIKNCFINGEEVCGFLLNSGLISYDEQKNITTLKIPKNYVKKESSNIVVNLYSGEKVSEAINLSSVQADIGYMKNEDKLLIGIFDAIEKYKNSQPNFNRSIRSNSSVEDFTNNILKYGLPSENVPGKRVARIATDMDGYITTKANLNANEIKIYNSNKAKGILCMANGYYALKYSKQNYRNDQLHNGNGDAFRHALWNYGMAIDVGSAFAKQWSDAHESGAVSPQIEKTMDYFNNSVGLGMAKTFASTAIHMFQTNTKTYVRKGKMYRILNNRLYLSDSTGEL